MSIAKVIEVIAESEESWEDAARSALRDAAVSVSNIKSLYVKDMQAIVENDVIVKYRIVCKITFVVQHRHEHDA